MPEANALDAVTVAHLTLVAEERLRVTRWSLALRPLSLAAVTAAAVVHAGVNPSRYMFLAPALAVSAWLTDAALVRRAQRLDALGDALRSGRAPRPLALSMDLAPWSEPGSWRVALLGGARLRWFLPLAAAAAAIAIDAQRFGPDDSPGELVWYLVLLVVSLGAASLGAWSWWMDRFGDPLPSPSASLPAIAPPPPRRERDPIAHFAPRPSREPEVEPVRWAPKFDPNERPFPDARPSVEAPVELPRSGTTQTFATVELDGIRPDPPKPD